MNKMIGVKKCPYCGTVYRYGDLLRLLKKCVGKDRKEICYHCQEEITISLFPKIIPAALIWLVMSVGTNILLLSGMKVLNIPIMMIVTVIYIAVFVLILPLCLSLKENKI